MKILEQNLSLSAQRDFYQQQQFSRQQQTYLNGRLRSETQHNFQQIQQETQQTQLQISAAGKWQSQSRSHLQIELSSRLQDSYPAQSGQVRGWNFRQPNPFAVSAEAGADKAPLFPEKLQKMIEAIEALMERMTGRPYKLEIYGYSQADETNTNPFVFNRALFVGEVNQPSEAESVQWQQSFSEQETLHFQAQGQVSTADGRQIDFALNTLQAREFSIQSGFRVEQGAVPRDPLVVSFGGQPAQLSLHKIGVDLDMDGKQEQVAMMQAGSGYLVLDENGDGKIDQGSELFGASSGDGFAELAVYDSDQNGWIDENDPIFAQLRIYHQDANGLLQLDGLMNLDIGAISLASLDTQFSYKDQQNQTQAEVRSSGVFLFESSAQAGLVQQIDLMV